MLTNVELLALDRVIDDKDKSIRNAVMPGSYSVDFTVHVSGNMEVLERVGTPEQKERWLKPLLNGEIRSCYAMTEPGVASSDAKNIATRAELVGDEWVING